MVLVATEAAIPDWFTFLSTRASSTSRTSTFKIVTAVQDGLVVNLKGIQCAVFEEVAFEEKLEVFRCNSFSILNLGLESLNISIGGDIDGESLVCHIVVDIDLD